MPNGYDLSNYLVPPGCGAGFSARRSGGLALLRPLTPEAEIWLHDAISDDVTWHGDELVIEMNYYPALVDAIVAAGFLFETDRPVGDTRH